MISQMKANSVIIDVSIDQGGCFETSRVTNHDHPTFRKYDVIHYCVPNIASRVSRTASYALTNILSTILLAIGEAGGVKNLLWETSGVRNGVYAYLDRKSVGKAKGVSVRGRPGGPRIM